MVPKGKTPSVLLLSSSSEVTALMVPSPPPATMISESPRAARLASSTISAPELPTRMVECKPSRANNSYKRAWSVAFSPGPDLLLTMTSMFTANDVMRKLWQIRNSEPQSWVLVRLGYTHPTHEQTG